MTQDTHPDRPRELLKSHGIRITYQRVAVLKELLSRRDHPRAEDIQEGLRASGHILSRATVYNTLSLFSRQGLLKILHLEAESQRFDVEVQEHGHFLCEGCGSVFNVGARLEDLKPEGLEGFRIRQRELNYRGLCPACARAQDRGKQKKEETA